jgi:hypothetical protein
LEGEIRDQSSKEPNFQAKTLLKQAYLWHKRLGHISIKLLKLTAKNTVGMPDFSALKETDFQCLPCLQSNFRRLGHREKAAEPARAFDIISGDVFSIKPYQLHPNQRIGLLLVNRKTRLK